MPHAMRKGAAHSDALSELRALVDPGRALAPFRVDGMTVVTDRHIIIATSEPCGATETPDPYNVAEARKLLTPSANRRTISIPALRAWAGPVEPVGQQPCARCKGAKEEACVCDACDNEHTAPCPACEGAGVTEPMHPRRPGVIMGVVVNQNLVAKVLQALHEDMGDVWTHAVESRDGETVKYVGIRTSKRLAVIAGLASRPSPDMPVFALDA